MTWRSALHLEEDLRGDGEEPDHPLGFVDRLHVIEDDQCELSDLLDSDLRASFCLVDIGQNVVARGSPRRGHHHLLRVEGRRAGS